MFKIAILGCGNIGGAVAEGLINGSFIANDQLILTKRNVEAMDHFAQKGASVTTDNLAAVKAAKYIIIAVKPYKVNEVLDEIKPAITADHVLISLASEIAIDQLKEMVQMPIPYFRAMPNTAASIGESLTCISELDATENDRKIVREIFENIGETVLIDENLMEAATILGACGIAYVLRFIRAMIQGGVQIGFDAETATRITTQTVKGAAGLLHKNQSHPEAEIDKVTTPKGCTITGLNEMEHQGFSAALIRGINASFLKIEK